MATLIVLPSYNERQNIIAIVTALLETDPGFRVCVGDDSSPDGTSEVVSDAIAHRTDWHDRVHLITRAKKDGRGGAVRAGFAWALAGDTVFDAFVEMDCDFSHEPLAVQTGLQLLRAGNDLVIVARYPRGTIVGWPLRRRIFSLLANQLARYLIDRSIADYTNGFRFYSERAAKVLVQQPQRHKG